MNVPTPCTLEELLGWLLPVCGNVVLRNEQGAMELRGAPLVIRSGRTVTLYQADAPRGEAASHLHLHRGRFRSAEVVEPPDGTPHVAFRTGREVEGARPALSVYFLPFRDWSRPGAPPIPEHREAYARWVARHGRAFRLADAAERPDHAFSDAERAAVYRAIHTRRDVRAFRPEPLPPTTVRRLLEAAHHAPSVGHMQPWDFLIVRDPALRRAVHAHFTEINEEAARLHPGDRGRTYRSLKLQGILDAPLNLLVTCDRSRAGPHVLGRSVQRDTDLYSTCLAVQNLWLAARAEGVGVGWMSIAEPAFLRRLFGLPEQVVPVAYLTLGWPVELLDAPLLERVGWRQRLGLEQLVHEDRWGRRADLAASARAAVDLLPRAEAGDGTPPPEALRRRRARLTRPPGSLGALEDAVERIALVQGRPRPLAGRRRLLLLAGDHGVARRGVSAYRSELTARMVLQFVAGGAAINAIARELGIEVRVADLGVDHDLAEARGVIPRKVGFGTRDIAEAPAMDAAACEQAIAAGAGLVAELGPTDLLALGEMGIGNSTVAAALAAALLGLPPEEVVGRGTGVGPRTRAHKAEVVRRALERHGPDRDDPTAVLASLGGFEIAGLVGAVEEAARRRIPVVLDGFITGVAALAAARRRPEVREVLLAGHRGAEPGHGPVLEALGLRPLLDLGLRLGEGSGAALAMGVLAAACRAEAEMVTFEEAGIEDPERPEARR